MMRAQTQRRASPRQRVSGIAVAILIGTSLLAAGCGGASGGKVAGGPGMSRAGVFNQALAFAQCMRTHGEPKFADPTSKGGSVQERITAVSGVDPNSPQFTAARNACKHLLPHNGTSGLSSSRAFTAAEKADYLKAAACIRSHGVTDFPDPTFAGNSVAFKAQASIDTSTPQYEQALAVCQKLIPAGLPYSSTSG